MTIKLLQAFALVAALATPAYIAGSAAAQQTPAQKPPTADKQSQTKEDLALARQIRREVVKDKSLSVLAHNCKIITQQGFVTLRGEVKTDAERSTIGDIATRIAGAGRVTNSLTVKK